MNLNIKSNLLVINKYSNILFKNYNIYIMDILLFPNYNINEQKLHFYMAFYFLPIIF